MAKMNTEKQPQKQTHHYSLISKGAPPTLREMQEKVRLLIRKIDPPAPSKQQTQSKFGKRTTDKSTSMSRKLQTTSPDNTNIHSTLNISVSIPPLD